MIVERSLHPQFVSNTYLVADGEGGPAFFVDAGGPVQPLIARAKELELEPTHILLTHHHYDHVLRGRQAAQRRRWPELRGADPAPRRARAGSARRGARAAGYGTIDAGEPHEFGALSVRPLRTPGHTAGMLSFLVGDARGRTASRPPAQAPSRGGTSTAPGGFMGREGVVFTGDTLFKDSVGGVRAPGHTTYADLRDSIMGTLMELPKDTVIHPGHAEDTSVGREWEQNAFIRVWRGLDPEGAEPCTALGEPATLILLGDDYDGGKKAWVRWPDGADDIVPGSQVKVP